MFAVGQISPAGLKRALQAIIALIYLVWQVLVFIQSITKSEGE